MANKTGAPRSGQQTRTTTSTSTSTSTMKDTTKGFNGSDEPPLSNSSGVPLDGRLKELLKNRGLTEQIETAIMNYKKAVDFNNFLELNPPGGGRINPHTLRSVLFDADGRKKVIGGALRKSTRRKSTRRKSTRRKSTRRKSTRRKSTRRN